MSNLRVCISLITGIFILCSPVLAALEWAVDATLPLAEEALDVAESADGKRLFILTKNGQILVLDQRRQVESTIKGPFIADRLIAGKDGKHLYLTRKGKSQLQVVSLIDRFRIPVGQSPVKGDIAAAVTVAVFSDFQ